MGAISTGGKRFGFPIPGEEALGGSIIHGFSQFRGISTRGD